MIRSLARLGIVAGAVSVAIWLLPASVAIVSWRAGGPSRLAFLSPLSSFWLALASVTAAVVIAASVWRTTGRSLPEFARACAPLSILFLWLVPFVPWIADRAPALLIFAGPLRWAVVATAIAGVVDATGGWTWLYDRFRALRVDPRLALVVAFLVYAAM